MIKVRNKALFSCAAMLFALAPSSYSRKKEATVADMVVVRARVYTANRVRPWVEAVAVRGGKIIAVGTNAEVQKYRGAATKVVDAGGHLVLPGFVDCHIHFLDGSLGLGRVNLEGAKDVAEIQARLRDYATKHPGTDWVLGRGWGFTAFGGGGLPRKEYLDEIFPKRPVFLEGDDGHTYWANSKALALAGVSKETPDPPNGTIVHDAKTGEPTGALKESADELVNRVVPKPSREEKLAALRAGIHWANRHGLTRVHSARYDFGDLDLFEELKRRGELSVRFYIAYFVDPPRLERKDLAAMEAARAKYHDDWLDAGAVKFMVDGVVETHTAAMLEPYTDEPSLRGKLFWDPHEYKAAVAELDKRGFQVFTHAIGDLGVRAALDSYENAARINHTADGRPRIEHIETISVADIPRFGQLGVVASMQPLHSYPDADTLDIWARNIGPERASRGWAWKSIAAGGGKLVFGSDWPVVTLNPWEGVQTAVTRQTTDGKPEEGFVASQRISVGEAIDAYTIRAAFAGRREKTEGSLEPGKVADLIVVSQDVFRIDPHSINKTQVVLTMVGGRIVYQNESLALDSPSVVHE